MLLVRQIKVQPFTKIRSFDEDRVPDGIGVVLSATDQFGDPVKIVGNVYFELYEFRDASADRKGNRLEYWTRDIKTAQDEQRYWDRMARWYEFPLAWTSGLPETPSRKFVLMVSYHAPWDETLTDEYILDVMPMKQQIAGGSNAER